MRGRDPPPLSPSPVVLRSSQPARHASHAAPSQIGRAISLAYAREGASLVNADLRPEPSSRGPSKESIPTHELITAAGGTSSYHHLDATKPASFTALLGYVRDEYGRLDVMVNNAGLALGREQGADCPIWESTEESWARTMDINAGGVFWGTRAAAGVMVAQEVRLSSSSLLFSLFSFFCFFFSIGNWGLRE